MAFSTGGGRGKGLSDINVTPLVDVMLVLLIIFMVTAPLIQQGVKIALPKTKAAQMDDKKHNLVLTIDKTGQVFIDDVNVPLAELQDKLAANAKVKDNGEVDIKADRDLPYGTVVDVMAKAQAAGVTNIGMVTDPSGPAKDDADKPSKKHGR